jgi:hypothetical protein
MADGPAQDLLSLDRAVARAATGLRAWRASMARAPAENAGHDAIEPVRHVAGKSTWDALKALEPLSAEGLLRDALLPWVGTLTLARLTRDEEVEQLEAMAEPAGRYAGDPARMVSWRQAWRGVPASRAPSEATLWLDAAAGAGSPLAAIAARRADTRMELARRLGLAHPWELLGVGERGLLREAARRVLDATEDLARALEKEARHDVPGAAAVLHAAVARDAPEGWPAQITTRWLQDVVAVPVAGLKVDLSPLPPALGASSFARALLAFGFALREAWAPAATPFVLTHEPGARASHRLGFVLGALVASADWQVRALGVARRTAAAQSRVLGRMLLLETRLQAARLLLGDDAAPAPRDLFDELGPRLFGAPLDARLRGAWPVARDDEPARFVALVESHAASDDLRERFDVDWFRNPRAWTHLRAAAASPVREPVDAEALPARVDALARALEGALG